MAEENKSNEQVVQKLDEIGNSFASLANMMKGNMLSSLEADKEQKRSDDESKKDRKDTNSLLGELIGAVKATVSDDNPLGLLGLMTGLLVGAIALLVGFIAGYLDSLKDIFKGIRTAFEKFGADLKKWWKDSKLKKYLDEFIDNMRTKFRDLKDRIMNSKLVKGIEEFIENTKTKFRNLKDRIMNSKLVKGIEEFIDNTKAKFQNLKDRIMNSKLVKGIEEFIDNTKAKFTDLKNRITNSKLFKGLEEFIENFKGKVKGIKNAMENSNALALLRIIKDFVVNTLSAILAPITGVINDIKNQFPDGTDKKSVGIFQKIKDFIMNNPLTKALDDFLGPIKKLVPIFEKIGRIAGRIFAPINFILTAIDAVSAFTKGYEEGGFIGGIKESVAFFISDIVGAPIDLLRDVIAWIAGKLGFTEFEKQLNELGSVTDFIYDFTKKTFDWFIKLFTNPTEALQEFWTGLVGEGGLIDSITGFLGDTWDWFKGFLPTNVANYLEEFWTTMVGDGGFLGILFAPLRAMIKFVEDALKFILPEEYSDWSLLGIIDSVLAEVSEWIEGLFNFGVDLLTGNIPSIDDIFSGLRRLAKNIIDSAPDLLKDYVIPDELLEWANATPTPTGGMVEAGAAQLRTAEAVAGAAPGVGNNTVVTNSTTNTSVMTEKPKPYANSKAQEEGGFASLFGF